MSKTILIVEDDRAILKSLVAKLSLVGFHIITAENGKEGLQKATEKPDLILLDLVMPVMDGITMLKKLKESSDTQDIPVIVLTNLSDEKTIENVIKNGCTDYLVKTDYSLDELIRKVKERLNV